MGVMVYSNVGKEAKINITRKGRCGGAPDPEMLCP